ncbi:hypothetical protein TSAR_005742 [Trichomalopsis sarcophagae]|uniref:Uncharacterized protein n=1 Tax=Trichomalopsis sarcophagae TaxID=543379 RepID=A0A232FEN5_9HYME|nr:hypothetical protein TSAR_005742 [Trichomalopsis sarcophagae]
MVAALAKEISEANGDTPKKFYFYSVTVEVLLQLDLDYFNNRQTCHFFKRFKLDIECLGQECSQWSKNKLYIKNKEKIKKKKVINDCAERAVHLCQVYVNILTKDEQQKQYLIQCVDEYNKKISDVTKKKLGQKTKKNPRVSLNCNYKYRYIFYVQKNIK